MSTGHACQQRPRPSAPDRAGTMLRSTQWAKPPLAHASTSLRDPWPQGSGVSRNEFDSGEPPEKRKPMGDRCGLVNER